jgi:hypothetical protein
MATLQSVASPRAKHSIGGRKGSLREFDYLTEVHIPVGKTTPLNLGHFFERLSLINNVLYLEQELAATGMRVNA